MKSYASPATSDARNSYHDDIHRKRHLAFNVLISPQKYMNNSNGPIYHLSNRGSANLATATDILIKVKPFDST